MTPNQRKSPTTDHVAKLIITAVFMGAFGLFIGWMIWGPGMDAFQLSWMDLVLLSLATYRMGHLISYDRVMEPLRSLFTETVPDSTGAGDSVEPKGTGFQNAIGQLLCCPICSGTWAAAGLVYALYTFPAPARVFITILAAVGAAEILNAAGELFSWGGQYARTMSGAQMKSQLLDKERRRLESIEELDSLEGIERDSRRVKENIFSRRD
jgi:hypothetical protein